jgi:hypothetical protein
MLFDNLSLQQFEDVEIGIGQVKDLLYKQVDTFLNNYKKELINNIKEKCKLYSKRKNTKSKN